MGARARIGEASIVEAVLLGVPSLMMFDWVFWWAGRRWGDAVFVWLLGGPGPRPSAGSRACTASRRASARWPWCSRTCCRCRPRSSTPRSATAGCGCGCSWSLDALGDDPVDHACSRSRRAGSSATRRSTSPTRCARLRAVGDARAGRRRSWCGESASAEASPRRRFAWHLHGRRRCARTYRRGMRSLILLPAALAAVALAGAALRRRRPAPHPDPRRRGFTRVDPDSSVDLRLHVGEPQRVRVRAGEKVIDDVGHRGARRHAARHFDHDGLRRQRRRRGGLRAEARRASRPPDRATSRPTASTPTPSTLAPTAPPTSCSRGTPRRLDVELDGSGDADLADLKARAARVKVAAPVTPMCAPTSGSTSTSTAPATSATTATRSSNPAGRRLGPISAARQSSIEADRPVADDDVAAQQARGLAGRGAVDRVVELELEPAVGARRAGRRPRGRRRAASGSGA